MENIVIYVGNKLNYNFLLKEYIERKIANTFEKIDAAYRFDKNDKKLFLELENFFKKEANILIVTTKETQSIIGKLICTITADSLVLKEGFLLPNNTKIYTDNSYLLEHEKVKVNVLTVQEHKSFPETLFKEDEHPALLNIFNEEVENIEVLLAPLAQSFDVNLHFSSLVEGWVIVQVQSKKYGQISKFIAHAKTLLEHKVIATHNVFAYIVERLSQKGLSITTAESCTGGLISALITKESGSSAIFKGSLVTYSNAAKASWLGVDVTNLERYGAVSQAVVENMLEGAINITTSDFAIGVSGVAGPTGGSEDKPVGTVYIGVRYRDNVKVEKLFFEGDRNYIQKQSAYYAIKMLFSEYKDVLIDK